MVPSPGSDREMTASGSSEDGDVLDLADDEGWEDLEPDVETVKVVCLICDVIFEGAQAMLEHCKDNHQLDIVSIRKDLGLDFLDVVKLVNYIRSEVKVGVKKPDVSAKSRFKDEQYLLPVLEDDALLWNLHDIVGQDLDDVDEDTGGVSVKAPSGTTTDRNDESRVAELEKKLQLAELELEARRSEIKFLQLKFEESESMHEKFLDRDDARERDTNAASSGIWPARNAPMLGNTDSSYFASYSGHEIHETMLKDTVRTDAYRDFIYENKHLFEGKTVLDVGCGTGILSMFCARAGAAKVIAVDNSDIIDFARENVYKNGMGETISCLRGKIEEVVLPVKKVDIIVSEWMGYCLLYEAMLDSVIWARDQYLTPDGLMIPSHCTLRIAPMTDSEYIEDHIHHWKDVYGFDMISMYKDIYNDVMVREVQDFAVPAESAPFLRLSLKTSKTEELSFASKAFACELKADIEALDGFVIWFDTFFLTKPDGQVPPEAKAEEYVREGGECVAFTTGPHGKRTHWQQGVLLIDYRDKQSIPLKKGQVVNGTIGYQKRRDDNRALDINLHWQIDGSQQKWKQSWSMC